MPEQKFQRIANTILNWAEERDFKGSDPYDGLNSRLLSPLLKHSRFLRLATIQAVKRSPLNLRPILMVPASRNPKGLALFLSGLGYQQATTKETSKDKYKEIISKLEQMILSLASKPDGTPAFSKDRAIRTDITEEEVNKAGTFAWGYNFPWQSRAFLQPAWYPTVVCSSFILDALYHSNSRFYPAVARSLARFTVDTLNIHKDDSGICFSYSPRDNTRVYNASLFAAKILAQAAQFTETQQQTKYRDLATQACNYIQNKQNKDGSWIYGEADHWQWIDNLHTGFVLETMQSIAETMQTKDYNTTIARGLDYYRTNLFNKDGTAKYYNNSTYPLDPHSFAQGAITLAKLNHEEQAKAVLNKAIEKLWDENKKGFIFQKEKNYTVRQVHLRWSQAWMFKAFSYINSIATEGKAE
ncbi:MAG: hypothetical protein KAR40_05465 [Candidatus Sabulitectum sp.]|nr:hypothetical protein [Candidatus Sabulitectum sp.]